MPLFSTLYDDFVKFSENREKEFRILIFFVLVLGTILSAAHLNIRSNIEIETATRALS